MKTKEEILFPLHTHIDGELDVIYTHEDALKAMDIHAKQVALAFKGFCDNLSESDLLGKSEEQLFELFKQENNGNI